MKNIGSALSSYSSILEGQELVAWYYVLPPFQMIGTYQGA
jgi:hypothetical protein